MDIETIHDSLVNGQRKQMVAQIDEYGALDFWTDYKIHLMGTAYSAITEYSWFADAVRSYFRVKNP